MVFIFANTLIMLMISHCYDTEQYILYSAFYFHACLPVFNSEKINFTTFLGSHNCSITCELFLEQGRRPTHSSLVTPVLKHQIRFPYTVLSKDYGDALWCFNPVFVFKLLLFIWDFCLAEASLDIYMSCKNESGILSFLAVRSSLPASIWASTKKTPKPFKPY